MQNKNENDDFFETNIEPIQLQEFLSMEFPPRADLLSPWLPEKGIAMIHAPRGVGKTFLALNVAYAVATGSEFLRWKAPVAQPILYLDGEMPAILLQERLASISKSCDKRILDYGFRLLPYDLTKLGGPDLSTEIGQRKLETVIEDSRLIIVDNISTICRGGKENEAESWAAIQSWALDQRRKGRSVLFIHHSGKGGDQRGTSKREDVMDSILKLSRPQNYQPSEGARFIVDYTKMRGVFGDPARSFEAILEDGKWTDRPIESSRDNEIIALSKRGFTQREIAAQTNCSPATVNRALKNN